MYRVYCLLCKVTYVMKSNHDAAASMRLLLVHSFLLAITIAHASATTYAPHVQQPCETVTAASSSCVSGGTSSVFGLENALPSVGVLVAVCAFVCIESLLSYACTSPTSYVPSFVSLRELDCVLVERAVCR
ncbi:hypothetical protein V8E55_009408 [Tylopilus felleus]